MPSPGFVHNGFTVLGLVEEIQWGTYDVAVQKASAFGVEGTSVIDGGLRERQFGFPMMIWGFTTPQLRDLWFTQYELNLGMVGELQVYTAGGLIVDLLSVRFASLLPGRSGWDPVHLYFRRFMFGFEQLQPPALAT